MTVIKEGNITNSTIKELCLRLSNQKINAKISPDARVFEYTHLENVFIMENDLYGNVMPKDSCFLAFYGHHGLMGKQLSLDTLLHSSVNDIKHIVESNTEG